MFEVVSTQRCVVGTGPDTGMSLRADWEFDETDRSLLRRWVTPITVSALLLTLTTGLLWLIDVPIEKDHFIFFYLVPTAVIAIRYGSISAMGVAVASAFASAYLFYVPRYSFAVADPLDLLELVFFSLLALLASQVVSGFDHDDDIAKRPRRTIQPARRSPMHILVRAWRRFRS
jgi:K+-sensing histidine kinase KdpD